jgi:type IV secretory pathway VirB3-like protein
MPVKIILSSILGMVICILLKVVLKTGKKDEKEMNDVLLTDDNDSIVLHM